jgi:hypothetical protein
VATWLLSANSLLKKYWKKLERLWTLDPRHPSPAPVSTKGQVERMVSEYRRNDLRLIHERRHDPQTGWPTQSRRFRHPGGTTLSRQNPSLRENLISDDESHPPDLIRRIPRDVLDDLSLWLDFLQQTQLGISLNILTTREPTTLYRADECKHGIWGFNVFHCRARRFPMTSDLQNRATPNVLKVFASIVGPTRCLGLCSAFIVDVDLA